MTKASLLASNYFVFYQKLFNFYDKNNLQSLFCLNIIGLVTLELVCIDITFGFK